MLAISKETLAVAGNMPGDDTTIGFPKGTPMRTLDSLTHDLRTLHGRHRSLLALLDATRLRVTHDRLLDTDRVAELDQRDNDLDQAAQRLEEAGEKWNFARKQRTTLTLKVLAEGVDEIDNLLSAAENLITGTSRVPVPTPSPVPVITPTPVPVTASGGSSGNGGGNGGGDNGGVDLDALLAKAQEIIDELEGRTDEKFVKVGERIDGVSQRVKTLEDVTGLDPAIVTLLNNLGADHIRSEFEGVSANHRDLLNALARILPDNASIEELERALKLARWTFKVQGKGKSTPPTPPAHS